jgi:hypothetical protein
MLLNPALSQKIARELPSLVRWKAQSIDCIFGAKAHVAARVWWQRPICLRLIQDESPSTLGNGAVL